MTRPSTDRSLSIKSTSFSFGSIHGSTNLWQSVPNPARNIVEIRYRLANDADVQLKLYDLNGREIATLDRGSRESGEHTVSFRVDDLAAGVYHYRLTADGTVLSRSLTVVK